jgi:tetratricopeptide (TPR) repeat protein
MKAYKRHPEDLLLNTTAMVMATEYLNDPVSTLQFNQVINIDTLDLNACTYCHIRCIMAMVAYMQIGDLSNAGKIADRMKSYVIRRPDINRMLSYYTLIQDTASIQYLIQKGIKTMAAEDAEARFNLVVARLAKVHGHPELSHRYANHVISLYGKNQTTPLARCLMLTGDYERAKKIFLAQIKVHPEDSWLYADLGIVYAHLGLKTEAEQMISALSKLKSEYDYGETSYFQARIKANLGETNEALQLIRTSLQEGIKFLAFTTFQEDPDMAVLNSNPEYQALLIQNRQAK